MTPRERQFSLLDHQPVERTPTVRIVMPRIRHLLSLLLLPAALVTPLFAGWGADSQPTRTTADHGKRVIGYVTQWDAWKGTEAGFPKQGVLNHLNLDYSQYTHLNFSFFGVANDGSLHSGDYRNQAIYQPGTIQNPASLFHGDVYSSWDFYLLWGELSPQWNFTSDVAAAGFVAENGGWRHTPSGLTGQMPVPFKPAAAAPGILDLAHSKGVKVMASIGGWSMCRHFPEMAADPVKRARFIAGCQQLIALGFDGIDFDWEYPGPFAGMNFTGSSNDFINFLTLVTELRTAIGPDRQITAAVSADPVKLAGFDWPALSAILDSINLMTYDFEGGWSDHAGHNARLFPAAGQETTSFSCQRTVAFLLAQGVSPSKLAMGLAFYGRGVVCNGPAALGAPTVKIAKTVQPDGPVVTAADFALWEPFDATPTYQRITQLMSQGWTRHWDDVAKVPYLTKGSSFLSYDDSHSIGEKARFAREQNLGGVIVWTAYGDLRTGELSTATSKLSCSPTTAAPLINVVNSVLAGDSVPPDGTEGPTSPRWGLDTLPVDRPIVAGYINALRSASGQDQVITDFPAAVQAANLEAFDLIITAFAKPQADGTLSTELGAFSSYLPAVVSEGHALGKSVIVSIGGAGPASVATNFATIAASSALRQSLANTIVEFLGQHHLDGVDIDYEFPANAGAARTDFSLLMQTIYQTVKAADPRYIVMFGSGPGWYLGSFDFSTLGNYCDFFFYFGYDWKNAANGPITKPGSVQWTTANDKLPEASVKGGIDYVMGKGFPAGKILCGLPFYGSKNRSWSAVRNLYAATPAVFDAAIDANSLEVLIDNEWFTSPVAMKRKMSALLDPGASVLAGGAVIRGVGCWEIGHEHASAPDLSTAFAEWIATHQGVDLSISVTGASIPEGDTGTSVLNFTVSLSRVHDEVVTVDYQISDGTATAGSDYHAASGTLTFAPGESSVSVPITVIGDEGVEADETFTLTLSHPLGAVLGIATATGTIRNDDIGPGPDEGWTCHALPTATLTLEVTDTWSTGFQGRLLFTNQTGAALTSWTLQFDAPFTVSSIWDGVYGGKSGGTLTITNPGTAGYSLANGATATIGFVGGGSASQPTNLRLNGQPVMGSGTSFAAWSAFHGSGAVLADPDGDGRCNLIEFLNGTLPKTGDAGHRAERRVLTVSGSPADYFCVIVPADRTAVDVEYRVLAAASPSMVSARLMVLHETINLGASRIEAVWRDTEPISQRTRAFGRVEARLFP